jgi:hypothetical protein
MKPYCTGTAKITHVSTGKEYQILSSELDWEHVGSEEREMGAEHEYQATLDHPQLGPLSWSVWEYPEGSENHKESNIEKHTMIEDFEYGLRSS